MAGRYHYQIRELPEDPSNLRYWVEYWSDRDPTPYVLSRHFTVGEALASSTGGGPWSAIPSGASRDDGWGGTILYRAEG